MAISTPSKTSNLFPDPLPDYGQPPKRRSGPGRFLALGVVGEWVVVVMGAVLVALLIKTFLIQAFFIPSESMKPTLEVGDRVLVNKMSYHLHPINRGDVVVFERLDGDGSEDDEVKDLIKRVIALPGETVVFKDNKVYIDGKRLNEPYLPDNTPSQPAAAGQVNWDHRCTTDDPCKIPPDSVWVMGDNRTNSRDSRYIGPIPDAKIVGRAFSIVWPFPRASGL
jgi:signal peptidase I